MALARSLPFRKIPAWRGALYADGAIGGLLSVLTGGTVLTALILWAGGGPLALGLLSSVTTGAGLSVILTRRLQRRFRSDKELTQVTWTLSRIVWLVCALALAGCAASGAFFLIVPLVLLATGVSAAAASIGNVTWFGWCAALTRPSERGTFLAIRQQWVALAALVALPVVGAFLDWTHNTHHDTSGYVIALVLGGSFALIGWLVFRRVPERLPAREDASTTRKTVHAQQVSAPQLLRYLVIWNLAVYLSAPFMQAYAMQRLQMPLGTIMNLQVLSQIVPVLTLGIWGKVVDRIGPRLPIALCSVGKAVVPICYLVSTPTFWWPVVLTYILSVLDAGITIGANMAYATVAEEREGSAKITQMNLVTSIVAGVTPFLAGLLAARVTSSALDILVVLFVASAIGRGLSGVFLLIPARVRRLSGER